MITKLDEPRPRLWTKDEYYKLGEFGFFNGQKVELWDGEIMIQYPDPQHSGLPYPSNEPHCRLWTKEEYYRLGELGFFQGQKVELWEGEIMVMSPQGPLHYSALERVADVLRHHFGTSCRVRTQGPIDLGMHTEPEPDVAVVRAADYSAAHPHGALLIVEVSDSTVSADRNAKASLYARRGVADYWIVNLVDHQLEVFRNPLPDATQKYGHSYADRTILQPGESISALASQLIQVRVADLLG